MHTRHFRDKRREVSQGTYQVTRFQVSHLIRPLTHLTHFLLITALLASALSGCGKTSTSTSGKGAEASYPAPTAENMDVQKFVESDEHWEWWDKYREKVDASANYQGSMSTYYQNIMEKILVSDTENTVCSPLNTFVAFAVLAEVTDGNTRQQILDMLQVKDINTLRKQVNAIWESNYVNTPVLKSLLANSLWLREGTDYNQETLQKVAEEYYASSFSGDPKSEKMNEAMRKWTDENTSGLLSDYIKDMKLDANTVLAIISTIYYKASWIDTFPEQNTAKETFHGVNGDTTADMMHMSGPRGVYISDTFTAVGLPLNDSGSMYFCLPDEGTDVNALADDPGILQLLYGENEENWHLAIVNLSVPKFSISCRTDLLDIIRELGITDALDPSLSDFTPLTKSVDNLYISSAEHAARVDVDETGVTGAAYTEMMIAEGALLVNEELDLVFDRPFLFLVTGRDGSVLFSGVVRNIE